MNSLETPERGFSLLPLRDSLPELAVTGWTTLSFYMMFLANGENANLLMVPLVFGVAAFFWLGRTRPRIARVDNVLGFGVYFLAFSILASYFFNASTLSVELFAIYGNLAATLLAFFALYQITWKIDFDLRKVLILQTLCCLPLFPIILTESHLQFGRVMPDNLTPNFVGMMALVAFIGACSVRSWFWGIVLAALPLYVIYVMQSRDAMLSAGIAAVIIFGGDMLRLGWQRVRTLVIPVLIGGPIVIIGLYFVGIDVIGGIVDSISNLFMLNDEHRGIDSGGSGRSDLWQAAVNIWLSHPVFGVGFKTHTDYMPDNMLAHNAFLGMLADLGACGLSAYLIIIYAGLSKTLRRGYALPVYPQRLAIMVSYLVYGMLESRGFSFGNTYSLLFLLVVFDSSKHLIQHAPQAEYTVRSAVASSLEPSEVDLVTRSKL